MMEAYKKFITSVLDKNFKEKRQEEWAQFPFRGLVTKNKLEDQWYKGDSYDFQEDEASKDAQSTYIVVDSDDPCDLFRMGQEVAGSCQSIDGIPEINKCLLGYVMNPANRVYAIKNKETGAIIVRSLVRLMRDEQGKPVLFYEGTFPIECPKKYEKALMELGKKRAMEMNIPMICYEEELGLPVSRRFLSSFQSRVAPFEYAEYVPDNITGTFQFGGGHIYYDPKIGRLSR
jgi:hypothetical protein